MTTLITENYLGYEISFVKTDTFRRNKEGILRPALLLTVNGEVIHNSTDANIILSMFEFTKNLLKAIQK